MHPSEVVQRLVFSIDLPPYVNTLHLGMIGITYSLLIQCLWTALPQMFAGALPL